MRKYGLIVFASAALIFGGGTAQASIIEFFFPMFREQPRDPNRNNMQAPFSKGDPQQQSASTPTPTPQEQAPMPQFALPENNLPLDQPHRSKADMSAWVSEAVAGALNYDTLSKAERVKEITAYFNPYAKKQYFDFLNANKIAEIINNNRYVIRSYVQEAPLLLNEGAIDGRYRWLFRMPVMVSYVESSKKDYSNADPVNNSYSVTVEVGRVKDSSNEHNVLIERWDATSN